MSVADNPTAEQCQYCGLQIARKVEKYSEGLPFSIDTDDKYLDAVEKVKNIILQTSKNPLTTIPKCAPKNQNNYSIPYVYFNPIPPKYNTGEPGFAIMNSKDANINCNMKAKLGGKRRRRRKKTRKKRRRRKKNTKKRRRRKR